MTRARTHAQWLITLMLCDHPGWDSLTTGHERKSVRRHRALLPTALPGVPAVAIGGRDTTYPNPALIGGYHMRVKAPPIRLGNLQMRHDAHTRSILRCLLCCWVGRMWRDRWREKCELRPGSPHELDRVHWTVARRGKRLTRSRETFRVVLADLGAIGLLGSSFFMIPGRRYLR